jgi:Flp pilus assembly protein CpaB
MATVRRNRKSSRMNPFLAGLFTLLALLGVIFTLEATDTTDLGLKQYWAGKPVMASNMTPVVLSMASLQPGERITTAKLWNSEQGTFNHKFMDKGVATKGAYMSLEEVLGRVMAKSKSPAQVFTERDFLPKGTPVGVSGLIPDGLVAVPIDLKRVKGIESLGFKDRFDLRIMEEADQSIKDLAQELLEKRRYTTEAERMQLAAITQGPTKRLLVQNGIVIQPATGDRKGTVTVAVHEDDVDATIHAQASGKDIYCTLHTGRPGGEQQRVEVQAVDPLADFGWVLERSREVELITGEESDRFVIPVGKSAAPEDN